MQSPTIHIVLVQPKMPSNTGNIIRLCANTGAKLHLVKPLGFELDDKKLRRAGLDYHEYANLQVYETWHDLFEYLQKMNCQHIVALTTKFSQPFYNYDFTENHLSESESQHIALIFGSETDGLPQDIRNDIASYHTIVDKMKKCYKENERRCISNTSSEFDTVAQIQFVHDNKNNWLRLPMLPTSRSLNLSNSVAICLYEVWRQLGFYGDEGKSIGYDVPNKET